MHACQPYLHSSDLVKPVTYAETGRDAGERVHEEDIAPLTSYKGGNGDGGALFIKVSQVISWFVKIELKQIHCSHSRTQKLRKGFL